MQVRRALFRYWAVIVFLAAVLQVGLAGYGAFYTAGKVDDLGTVLTHDQFEDGWGLHQGFGYGVVLGGIILVALAFIARMGKPWNRLAGLLALLLVVQVLLAWFGSDTAVIGAFHPINAFVIVALSGFLARSAWNAAAPATS